VYLKLQPYIQTLVAQRSNQKLAFRFFGPFTVLQRIGNVAYKLDLPPSAKIHPVVHVSQLKKHIPAATSVCPDLTTISTNPKALLVPEKFLDSKLVQRGSSAATLLLVHWSFLPPELATWEELQDLTRRFPDAPAWGQAGIQAGGMSQYREHERRETYSTSEWAACIWAWSVVLISGRGLLYLRWTCAIKATRINC